MGAKSLLCGDLYYRYDIGALNYGTLNLIIDHQVPDLFKQGDNHEIHEIF